MHTGAHRADSVFGTANMTEGQFREGNAALGRSKEELIQEFKNLIAEGQTLLKSTTSLSGEALTLAREELRAKLAEAKAKADELSVTARDGGRRWDRRRGFLPPPRRCRGSAALPPSPRTDPPRAGL